MASLAILPLQRQLTDDDGLLDFGAQPTTPSLPKFGSLFGGHLAFQHPTTPNQYSYPYGGHNNNLMDALMEDLSMETPSPNPFNTYGNPEQLNCDAIMPPPMTMEPPSAAVLPMQLLQRPQRRLITVLEQEQTLKKSEDEFMLCNPDIRPGHLMDKLFGEGSLFISNNMLTGDLGLGAVDQVIPGYENDYLFMEDFDEAAEAEDFSDDEDEDESNYFHVDDLVANFDAGYELQYDGKPVVAPTLLNQSDAQGVQSEQAPQQSASVYSDDFLQYIKPEVHDVLIPDEAEVSSQFEAMQVDDGEVYNEIKEEPVTPPSLALMSPEDAVVTKKVLKQLRKFGEDHTCVQVNPATGEPCNKHFSRPYDLIRHQETIHAQKKKIFRCVICEGRENGGVGNGKSKTFSRGDALSRHIKVKHHLVGQDAVDLINAAKENVEYLFA